MLANFEKTFFNKTKSNIPKEITQHLNKTIPNEFTYETIHNFCVIKPTQPNFKIEMNLDLSKDLIEKFNLSSLKKIVEFMYRTQRSLKVVPDENGCIKINNKKINIKDIVKFPLSNDPVRTELRIYPKSFPPPFKLKIEGEGIVKNIIIQRQPYEDMNKSYFKNIKDLGFELSYLLNEKAKNIKFSFNLNIKEFNSVKEILDGMKLYRAYLNGNFKLADALLPKPQSENKVIDNTIEFWNKILKLEQKLKVKFSPEFPLKEEDVCCIKELYRSLIEEKPYKQYVTVDKIKVKAVSENSIKKAKDDNNLVFSFVKKLIIKIWGKTISVFCGSVLFDCKISDVIEIDKDNLDYYLVLDDAVGKEIYQSSRYFIKEEDAQNYITNAKNVNEFKYAKSIKGY